MKNEDLPVIQVDVYDDDEDDLWLFFLEDFLPFVFFLFIIGFFVIFYI